MKPPVEHVRITARGKEVLVRIKRRTGLEHWNEICRIALCRSLANAIPPLEVEKFRETAISIEWKTFAGDLQEELASLFFLRACKDNVDTTKKEVIQAYFRAHLERGIFSLNGVKDLVDFIKCFQDEEPIPKS